MQILLVDETVSVLVDHVESLFELLDLRLVKHSKHVGGSPLGALLGGLPLGTFARHGGGRISTCAQTAFIDLIKLSRCDNRIREEPDLLISKTILKDSLNLLVCNILQEWI